MNFCCDLVDTENNDKVICSFDNDIGTSKMVDLLNEQYEQIKKLEKSVELLTAQLAHGVEFVMGDSE